MACKKDEKKNAAPVSNENTVNESGTDVGNDVKAEPEKEKEPSPEEILKAEKDELQDKLLRTLAEYDNFRKRSQKEHDAIYPEATANAIIKILPVMDSIDRAIAAECKDAEYKKGVELIKQAFDGAMETLGVVEIKAAGEKFDPAKHNAVMHIEDEAFGEGEVVEVFQKGYAIGDRVIRFAMVKVAN